MPLAALGSGFPLQFAYAHFRFNPSHIQARRQAEYDKKLNYTSFDKIRKNKRVKFLSYDKLEKLYNLEIEKAENLKTAKKHLLTNNKWILEDGFDAEKILSKKILTEETLN